MSFGEKREDCFARPAIQQTESRHQTKTIKLQGITFKLELDWGSIRSRPRFDGGCRSISFHLNGLGDY